MKFSVIGGAVLVLSGLAALAAVTISNSGDAAATASAAEPTGSIVLSVPDMHCEFACAPLVRETLSAVPGVASVETDVENQTATVVTTSEFDEEKAVAALAEAGYPSERVAD